jgi:WD40 repeat protein
MLYRDDVRRVFGDLLAQPVAARAGYLEAACQGNAVLRAEVISLLSSHDGAGGFLAEPTVAPAETSAVLEGHNLASLGSHIDRYKLLELIGEGGFGVVYLAAQEHPICRQVALKIIKQGMDTRQVIARFESERQLLALMDHPHIARVLDAGETQDGLPYFAMELVQGLPITRFCDLHRFDTRRRLELFSQVCLAVQHAHQKGVIHRDIKPSNVLVTVIDGVPVPKVIDFGIARAIDQPGADRLPPAEGQHFMGTPEYMSPEQTEIGGPDVDTRSDIYSLGVLLYELLAGRTPFDRAQLRNASFAEFQRTLREVVPPRPSVRVDAISTSERQSIAYLSSTDPRKLGSRLRRELDWISMKCLEKNPNHRYESVGALLGDLQRHGKNETVGACPSSPAYLLRKFLGRHKTFAWTAIAAVAVLLLVTGVALDAARRFAEIADEKAIALRQAETARQRTEDTGEIMRHNLYVSQMDLARQAAVEYGGLARTAELLAPWRNSLPDLRGWEWYYLNSLCNRDLLTLRGHGPGAYRVACAYCVAWRPDGLQVASCGADGTIKIWEAVTGREQRTLTANSAAVRCIAWSPDGKKIASVGDDKIVRIWDVSPGTLDFEADGGSRCVTWSPDGARLAWDGDNNTLVVMNNFTKQTRIFRGHEGPVQALAWNADSTHLASGGLDRTVRVWNAAGDGDGNATQALVVLHADNIDVASVAWNPDGRRLAAAGAVARDEITVVRNAIIVWDTSNGDHALAWESSSDDKSVSGHGGGVDSIAWNSNGTELVSASRLDWMIRVWDGKNGRQLSWFRGGGGQIFSVAWSPGDTRLAWANGDGVVRIRDAASRETPILLRGHTARIDSASWSRDSTLLATVSIDGKVLVHNVLSGKALFSLAGSAAVFNPAGDELAVVGHDGVQIVNLSDGHELWRPHCASTLGTPVWSPDGKYLACTCEADQTVRVFVSATGVEILAFPGATTLAWSPDGTRIAAGADRGEAIRIVDAGSGAELVKLAVPGILNLAWAPDGKRLASGHEDGRIRIFDATRGGDPLVTCREHTAGVIALSWSWDGSRLASTCRNEMTKIWDPRTGDALLSLRGALSPVSWSPDSLCLACEAEGHDVAILDASIGYAVERSAKALSMLDRRLKADPNDLCCLQLRADIRSDLDDFTQAETDIHRYLALSKGSPRTWFEAGCWVAATNPAGLAHGFAPEDSPSPSPACYNASPGVTLPVWQALHLDANGYLLLGDRFADRGQSSFYALERVYSCLDQKLSVVIGSDEPLQLWVNGRPMPERIGTVPSSSAKIPAEFKAGWNTLLVRMNRVQSAGTPFIRLTGL